MSISWHNGLWLYNNGLGLSFTRTQRGPHGRRPSQYPSIGCSGVCWPACLFDVRRNDLDLDLFEDDADVPPLFAVYFSFPLENTWTEHKIADQMRISLHHTWILDQVNGAIGANVPFPAASNYSLKPVRMPPFFPIAMRADRCAPHKD
ncbi:hypothetical protein B0H14DRAFT_3529908 [Mycena olivaceomarginata]|nr:hypothetical protein B0H14DRAFT_3529908 [Mycena olivaceomarginata]